jgi:hypothetical protein
VLAFRRLERRLCLQIPPGKQTDDAEIRDTWTLRPVHIENERARMLCERRRAESGVVRRRYACG